MFNGNILRDAIISAANNIANQKKAVDEIGRASCRERV